MHIHSQTSIRKPYGVFSLRDNCEGKRKDVKGYHVKRWRNTISRSTMAWILVASMSLFHPHTFSSPAEKRNTRSDNLLVVVVCYLLLSFSSRVTHCWHLRVSRVIAKVDADAKRQRRWRCLLSVVIHWPMFYCFCSQHPLVGIDSLSILTDFPFTSKHIPPFPFASCSLEPWFFFLSRPILFDRCFCFSSENQAQ